jgi:2-amino-4-hydroxy-6-hydroxymethyldihydropteridine diphosphokinase
VLTNAFIGIGANLGDCHAALDSAEMALAGLIGTRLVRVSGRYRSTPIDATGPDFINAVAEIETKLDAVALLKELHRIEAAAGRIRSGLNAPRTLDLDLLLYGDRTIQQVDLTVPHPRLHLRAFVLLPLAEIAPKKVAVEWLENVRDQRVVRLFS